MADHLLSAGHKVSVWNRTAHKAEPFRERGANVESSILDLAQNSEIVSMCVSRNEDAVSVVEQFPDEMNSKLVIDHSTVSPQCARELSRLVEMRGASFLDAPVTGGERGAVEGTLTIFCGGDRPAFERAKPVMEAYGRRIQLAGPTGSGQMMKMANQIAVSLSVLAMSECLAFAQSAGLDLAQTLELVGSGAGGSWSMTNYGPKVLERDWSPGFSVDLQQKDLMYALESAREAGVSLPGTALVHQLFAVLENWERGNEATPALFEVIEQMSNRRR